MERESRAERMEGGREREKSLEGSMEGGRESEGWRGKAGLNGCN